MVISEPPETLAAEALLAHVRQLSVIIGPRPPASAAEREAAAYVHQAISDLEAGWELLNQPFRSVPGFRYRIAPLAAAIALSQLFGLRASHKSHAISGLISIGLSILSRDSFLHRPAAWEGLYNQRESENVVVRIPPTGPVRKRVVFVAHMDSGLHRLTASPRMMRHLPLTLGSITRLALVGGVLTLLAGRNQRWRNLRGLGGLVALGGAMLAVVDEMGPYVAGANCNASGVATLLGLADALHHQPPAHTEVILAFTGSATATALGADMLAARFAAEWRDALWVLVENVGVGELCWVTQHGISPYATYQPDPQAVRVMEQVATARPDLGMMGRDLVTLDELALLQDRNLRAVALMAYDRATGLIPHWRQSSDTIHALNPATLERAAHACWTTVQVLDT